MMYRTAFVMAKHEVRCDTNVSILKHLTNSDSQAMVQYARIGGREIHHTTPQSWSR